MYRRFKLHFLLEVSFQACMLIIIPIREKIENKENLELLKKHPTIIDCMGFVCF